ncbi:uncharacterized protein LOC132624294 [Lycium barbarum]|uniref:uncharacterized protein LOC132624294 n=1 Tax=Lycium barbarum TaxID=112863 RepID=UPI00293EE99B|nr:uncharacterized protein LOC132624294 [Lycium barbarum]
MGELDGATFHAVEIMQAVKIGKTVGSDEMKMSSAVKMKHNLKLNPAKCAFGVPAGKLLGFIVSRKGIELDPSKIKAIQDLPPPKSKKDKDVATELIEECQKAFDRIKEFLSNLPVLVPPEPEKLLLLYLSVHRDFIRVSQNELNVMGSPWSFTSWGIDVIGPIEPPTSNGHRSILVAIDYFTKWVEASTYKAVTKKVAADFVRNNIVCRFGIPESIVTDNATNLNSDLMRETCEKFRIAHRNSTSYRPQMNGAVKAANKNIKKILRKITDSQRQWHAKLPYALLGYRTTARTSTRATPHMLVYGSEAVVPAEVEIPSLRITQDVVLDDAK